MNAIKNLKNVPLTWDIFLFGITKPDRL